jgi:hypothetical protein
MSNFKQYLFILLLHLPLSSHVGNVRKNNLIELMPGLEIKAIRDCSLSPLIYEGLSPTISLGYSHQNRSGFHHCYLRYDRTVLNVNSDQLKGYNGEAVLHEQDIFIYFGYCYLQKLFNIKENLAFSSGAKWSNDVSLKNHSYFLGDEMLQNFHSDLAMGMAQTGIIGNRLDITLELFIPFISYSYGDGYTLNAPFQHNLNFINNFSGVDLKLNSQFRLNHRWFVKCEYLFNYRNYRKYPEMKTLSQVISIGTGICY